MMHEMPRHPSRFSPFERKRRTVSRLALYGSALLAAGAAVAFVNLLQRPMRSYGSEEFRDADYEHLPEVIEFRDYVRIDTTDATGDEAAGARFLARELAAAGIAAHVQAMGPRKANLWAILEGRDPKAIVLHSHLDVENIHPTEDWFVPPFEARLDLPWIYGRGVFDMKSLAIAQLRAFIALKKSGRPLARSVILLATSSEETGSGLGARWLIANRPDLVRRFGTVLTEGGFVEARSRADIKYWGIEIGQKHYVDLEICGGSREPLEQIAKWLKETRPSLGYLRVNPAVREYLKRYAPTRDDERIRAALADPDAAVLDHAAFAKLPLYVQAFFRDEALPFDVEADPGGGFELKVVYHLLEDTRFEDVRDRLVPPGLLHGLAVHWEDPAGPHAPSPTGTETFRALVAAVERRYPQADVGPALLPWTATDSRFFRAAGIPSYGFSPFLILSTDTLQVDNANERLAIPGFVEGVKLYEELLRTLAL